jgi:hypothetical protein
MPCNWPLFCTHAAPRSIVCCWRVSLACEVTDRDLLLEWLVALVRSVARRAVCAASRCCVCGLGKTRRDGTGSLHPSCTVLGLCLSWCLPVCLSLMVSACLPVCLSACLSRCLPVCLSLCPVDGLFQSEAMCVWVPGTNVRKGLSPAVLGSEVSEWRSFATPGACPERVTLGRPISSFR